MEKFYFFQNPMLESRQETNQVNDFQEDTDQPIDLSIKRKTHNPLQNSRSRHAMPSSLEELEKKFGNPTTGRNDAYRFPMLPPYCPQYAAMDFWYVPVSGMYPGRYEHYLNTQETAAALPRISPQPKQVVNRQEILERARAKLHTESSNHIDYVCVCDETFNTLFELSVHIKETGHTPGKENTKLSDYPKLVRGQDMWLTQGSEQTKEILKCICCQESFKSLPDLTVHMMKTKHYTSIMSQKSPVLPNKEMPMEKLDTEEAVFACKDCNNRFKSMKSLSLHMTVTGHLKMEKCRNWYPSSDEKHGTQNNSTETSSKNSSLNRIENADLKYLQKNPMCNGDWRKCDINKNVDTPGDKNDNARKRPLEFYDDARNAKKIKTEFVKTEFSDSYSESSHHSKGTCNCTYCTNDKEISKHTLPMHRKPQNKPDQNKHMPKSMSQAEDIKYSCKKNTEYVSPPCSNTMQTDNIFKAMETMINKKIADDTPICNEYQMLQISPREKCQDDHKLSDRSEVTHNYYSDTEMETIERQNLEVKIEQTEKKNNRELKRDNVNCIKLACKSSPLEKLIEKFGNQEDNHKMNDVFDFKRSQSMPSALLTTSTNLTSTCIRPCSAPSGVSSFYGCSSSGNIPKPLPGNRDLESAAGSLDNSLDRLIALERQKVIAYQKNSVSKRDLKVEKNKLKNGVVRNDLERKYLHLEGNDSLDEDSTQTLQSLEALVQKKVIRGTLTKDLPNSRNLDIQDETRYDFDVIKRNPLDSLHKLLANTGSRQASNTCTTMQSILGTTNLPHVELLTRHESVHQFFSRPSNVVDDMLYENSVNPFVKQELSHKGCIQPFEYHNRFGKGTPPLRESSKFPDSILESSNVLDLSLPNKHQKHGYAESQTENDCFAENYLGSHSENLIRNSRYYDKEGIITCEYCKRIFRTRGGLRYHLISCLASDPSSSEALRNMQKVNGIDLSHTNPFSKYYKLAKELSGKV